MTSVTLFIAINISWIKKCATPRCATLSGGLDYEMFMKVELPDFGTFKP